MFEVGKEYIIKVTDNGFMVLDEFDHERYLDTVYDDIDLLTEAEKKLIRYEPPEAKWVYIKNKLPMHPLKIVECTRCHKRTYSASKYCPNCGALILEMPPEVVESEV